MYGLSTTPNQKPDCKTPAVSIHLTHAITTPVNPSASRKCPRGLAIANAVVRMRANKMNKSAGYVIDTVLCSTSGVQ